VTRALGVAAVLLALAVTASPAAASNARPVGSWRLDEGTARVTADSSGYGDDGTIVGDASWVSGLGGFALSFDGATGEVKVPNAPQLEPTSAVSVSSWVKSSTSPGDYRFILAKGGTRMHRRR
jgi:hypothetical protein